MEEQLQDTRQLGASGGARRYISNIPGWSPLPSNLKPHPLPITPLQVNRYFCRAFVFHVFCSIERILLIIFGCSCSFLPGSLSYRGGRSLDVTRSEDESIELGPRDSAGHDIPTVATRTRALAEPNPSASALHSDGVGIGCKPILKQAAGERHLHSIASTATFTPRRGRDEVYATFHLEPHRFDGRATDPTGAA